MYVKVYLDIENVNIAFRKPKNYVAAKALVNGIRKFKKLGFDADPNPADKITSHTYQTYVWFVFVADSRHCEVY